MERENELNMAAGNRICSCGKEDDEFRKQRLNAITTELNTLDGTIRGIMNYSADEIYDAIQAGDLRFSDFAKAMECFSELYEDEEYDRLIGAVRIFYELCGLDLPVFFTEVFESGNSCLIMLLFDSIMYEYGNVFCNFPNPDDEENA